MSRVAEGRFASRPFDEQWIVMMMDIDHFKLINDIHGHPVGDQIISSVGSTLSANANDIVIRYDGDEFLAVFSGTEQQRAMNFAQRVTAALRELVLPHDLRLTISMGVAESRSGETVFDLLVENADKALYGGKADGRDRISFWADITQGK